MLDWIVSMGRIGSDDQGCSRLADLPFGRTPLSSVIVGRHNRYTERLYSSPVRSPPLTPTPVGLSKLLDRIVSIGSI